MSRDELSIIIIISILVWYGYDEIFGLEDEFSFSSDQKVYLDVVINLCTCL